jgi:hypothetical protein
MTEVYTDLEVKPSLTEQWTASRINELIKASGIDTNRVSDGYHTFGELYDHRCILYIAMCKLLSEKRDSPSVWRSKKHADGSVWEGWFLLGISTRKGEQITYHLPEKLWNGTHFAAVLEKAPEFDGHTSQDVLSRILKLVLS